MNINKHVTQINDQADGDSVEPARGESGETPPIDEEDLFEKLSQLRLVRVPGEGPLELNQAIAVAIDQGEAFERWCETGAHVREIEVWVERLRGILVLPEAPAEFRKVEFMVPSPDSAVLQLVTQADGKRIVLYNLLLRDVPAGAGLRHTETWPNGQSITIQIKRDAVAVASAAAGSITASDSQINEFVIRLAVSSYASEHALRADADRSQLEGSPGIHEKDRSSVEKPKGMTAGAGASFRSAVLPILLLCLGLVIVVIKGTTPSNDKPGEQRPTLQAGDRVVEHPASTRSDSANPSATAISPDVPAVKKQQVVSGKHRNGGELAARDNGSDRTVQKVSHHRGENARVVQDQVSVSLWRAYAFPKLASMKNMYVVMDPQNSEPGGLKNLFVRALEASNKFHVVGDGDRSKADGVITLSFEQTSQCVDVVFVRVTGPDGKFLWQDHAWEARKTCVASPAKEHDTLFSLASAALVDNFENTVREAQKITEGKESMADGW